MLYFRDPVFDLYKFGKMMRISVSRHHFAKHVVDLAARLALQINDMQQLRTGSELLHDQIFRLSWRTYIWILPVNTHYLDYSADRKNIISNSLLGTAILYKRLLNSHDPDDQLYSRFVLRRGLEWLCNKTEYEGEPSTFEDIPTIDCAVLNSLFIEEGETK